MDSIQEVLAAHAVTSVYQPIVNLQSGDVIAYEALARGPEGTPFARPDVMFAQAREEGLLGELDWECRAAALAGALAMKMTNPAALFINIEAETLEAPVPPRHADVLAEGAERLRLVAEITERAIASRPRGLLQAVEGIRDLGAGIAVDDIGADDRSLGMLPFLRPDVVKLDLRLVQNRGSSDVASVSHAVSAHTERTGARVLAEGIETEVHLRTALSLGATLGQGWYFGRPEPLPTQLPVVSPWMSIPLIGTGHPIRETHTPFELLHAGRSILEADVHILLSMSRHLEDWASRLGPRGVIVAALQNATHATEKTCSRYEAIAETGAFAGVVGEGMNTVMMKGVATADLGDHDRLKREWSIAVLGPHFSAALAARELDSPTSDRRFAFGLTHNRELVVRMAGSMLHRLEEGVHD